MLATTETVLTVADLLEQLGDIAPARVRVRPALGSATVDDVLKIHAQEKRLYELVDGVLVEKAMGLRESFLAIALSSILWSFVKPRKLGIVSGEAGMLRLDSGLVRIPDVAFISWERLPNRQIPREPVPLLAPDLVVEILSPSTTPAEMARKRQEYFAAGVRLLWLIDPEARTVAVYTAPEAARELSAMETLDGGDVLPGFRLSLQELFAELEP